VIAVGEILLACSYHDQAELPRVTLSNANWLTWVVPAALHMLPQCNARSELVICSGVRIVGAGTPS
jgi:hypothetical protein